jgi:hypothetical protein
VTTDPQPVPPIAEELATVERLAVRLHEEFRPLAGDVLIFEDCLEIARLAVGTLRHEVATAYDRGLAEGRQDVERLTLLLEQAEQYARDLQDGGIFLHDEAVATVRQEGLAEGRRQRDAEYDVKLGGNGTTPPPVEMVYGYNVGLAEGRRQATEGLSVWEIRGYIADYGPYAAMSSSSGYNDPDEARAYFTTAIADTADALVLLVEVRAGGWERIADRWRPDPAVLAFERELDMDRLVGPWEPDEQPEPVVVERVSADESVCHRCPGPNSPWSAPSPLWNAVMRGGSIGGTDEFDGIVCPTCFAVLAQQRGIAELWRFSAERVHAVLETTSPDGRVWDAERWLWVEPASGGVVEPSPLTAEEAAPDCGVPNNPGGIFRPGTCKLPSGHPGWHEDGGLSWLRDREELERVVERGKQAPSRRQHDPGALIEEPDLYEQGGHLDGEFADERGKFDPLIGEQGEGGVR